MRNILLSISTLVCTTLSLSAQFNQACESQYYSNGQFQGFQAGIGFMGADISERIVPFGLTGQSNIVDLSVLDDFTIPAGQTWEPKGITFYAYSQPFDTIAYVALWQNEPVSGGNANFVATNILTYIPAIFTGVYRVQSSLITSNNRPIYAYTIEWPSNFPAQLTAGTYWLEWAIDNNNTVYIPPTNNVINPNAKIRGTATGIVENVIDQGANLGLDFPFMICSELICLPNGSTINETACGNSVVINGVEYFESGVYTQILQNVGGCDSTITINLTLQGNSPVPYNQICQDIYFNNGQFQGFEQSVGFDGADVSIRPTGFGVLGFTTTEQNSIIDDFTICNGQTWQPGGLTFYGYSLPLDTIDYVALWLTEPTSGATPDFEATKIPVYTDSEFTGIYRVQPNSITAFQRPLLAHSIKWPSNFPIELTAQKYWLEWSMNKDGLSLIPPTANTINPNAMERGRVTGIIGNITDPLSGTGLDFPFMICGDIICFNDTSNISITHCGVDFEFNNNIYSQSGIYEVVFTNQGGCDSIVYLDLTLINLEGDITINGTTLTANTLESNVEFKWIDCQTQGVINGEINASFTPTTGGSYTVTVSKDICETTYDCVTISLCGFDLNITNTAGILSVDVPNGTNIQWINCATNEPIADATNSNFTPTISGSYKAKLSLDNCVEFTNCIDIEVEVCDLDMSITGQFSYIATVGQSNAQYQWFECSNEITLIPGETDQTLAANVSGEYLVVVTLGNCVDTSECVTLIVSGIENLNNTKFLIFPNPAKDFVIVKSNNDIQTISISNIAGQIIYSESEIMKNEIQISLKNISSGTYILMILDTAGNQKFEKIIIH